MFDFPDKSTISKIKTGEKTLQLIRKIISAAATVNLRDYSNAFRLFMSQTAEPIMKCLCMHYDNHDGRFISKWALKKFKHGKFNTTVCSGGDVCGMA